MDAIVLAGGTPWSEDLLYPFTKGAHKAMLEICGKTDGTVGTGRPVELGIRR